MQKVKTVLAVAVLGVLGYLGGVHEWIGGPLIFLGMMAVVLVVAVYLSDRNQSNS